MTGSISQIVIEATTEIAVLKNDNTVLQPGSIFKAWQETSTTANVEGVSGSLMPIALKIPTDKISSYSLSKLRVTGKCVYPTEYPRIVECRLVGTLKRAPQDTPSISSKPWSIALPTTNPPSDQLQDFVAEEFSIPAVFAVQPCPFPFRIAGDFQWEIICTIPNGMQSNFTFSIVAADSLVAPLSYDKETRLEIVWLKGPAPAGPTTAPGSFVRTVVDLCGSYPIDLLRLYLPSPTDLATFTKEPDTKLDYRDWWLQQSLKRLPADVLLYDMIAGKSRFGMGCCGGSFMLKELTTHVLSMSNTQPALINSFDLAALIQLAYGLLVDTQGIEVQYNRWVCKTPFGSMSAGLPFGLTDKTTPAASWPQGINNPYFWGHGMSKFSLILLSSRELWR